MKIIARILKKILIFTIYLYKRIISPMLPASCRFYPTCSEYAITALHKYGVFKGLFLAIKRVIRCNPFNKGGYDPVP